MSVDHTQGLITNSWTFGGTGDEQASTFDMDPSGKMYVTGLARSPGMTSGQVDIFTFKFNPSNGQGEWGTYFGSPASDKNEVADIVVSPDFASVYIVGTEQISLDLFGDVDMLMA